MERLSEAQNGAARTGFPMTRRSLLQNAIVAALGKTLMGSEQNEKQPRLRLLSCEPIQENGSWIIWYKLQYEGYESLSLNASDINVRYNASVSNSSLKPHEYARESKTTFNFAETNSVLTSVIPSAYDRQSCHERIAIGLSTQEKRPSKVPEGKLSYLPFNLLPQQSFWLCLTIDHAHFLYGTYDPLLGKRNLEVQLGSCRFIDTIDLLAEINPAKHHSALKEPPPERMSQSQFCSAPNSLYLAADIPGYQYYRFDDVRVRFGTKFSLRFRFLIATGSEGSHHVRVMEYQDTPNAWRRLKGGFDEQLAVQGQWQTFEQVFTMRNETTTMALDFRIIDANIGEMWIDDVELIALNEESNGDERTQKN